MYKDLLQIFRWADTWIGLLLSGDLGMLGSCLFSNYSSCSTNNSWFGKTQLDGAALNILHFEWWLHLRKIFLRLKNCKSIQMWNQKLSKFRQASVVCDWAISVLACGLKVLSLIEERKNILFCFRDFKLKQLSLSLVWLLWPGTFKQILQEKIYWIAAVTWYIQENSSREWTGYIDVCISSSLIKVPTPWFENVRSLKTK
jgi:hypothetical protein